MYLQVALFVLGAVAVIEAGIPCNCGLGSGYDVHETAESRLCHGHGSEHKLVIRPDPYISPSIKEKYESNSIQKAERIISGGAISPPQKDYISLCSCPRTFVTPALVPAPPCHKCGHHAQGPQGSGVITDTGSYSEVGSSSSSLSSGYESGSCCQQSSNNQLQHVPADPVSISIALGQYLNNANIPRNTIAERDIAFGFQKLPTEITRQYKQTIDEKSLNAINGQVLDLKLPLPGASKSVEEEAYEELLAQQEELEELESHNEARKLTLSDLGYINSKGTDQKFVNVQLAPKPASPATCNDFYPGKVVLKEEVRVPSYSVKERETVCVGGEHHKSEHVWSSGRSNTLFKHIGSGCGGGCNGRCAHRRQYAEYI